MAKAFVYNTLKHGPDIGARPDSIQHVPNVLVCAFPFKYPSSYGLDPNKWEVGNLSDAQALATNDPVILKGITKASVSTSKRSHTVSMNVELIDKDNEYLNMLNPGDWITCSMFNEPTGFKRVKTALQKKRPNAINGFMDGLKFLGRIQTIRRVTNTNQRAGQKIRRVIINATAFAEFDTAVYFDPALDIDTNDHKTFSNRFFGRAITNLDVMSYTSAAIPALINALVGSGPGGNSRVVSESINGKEKSMLRSPNAAFNVPDVVADVLGVPDKDPERAYRSLSSVLTCIYGVQNYDGQGFIPVLRQKNDSPNRYYTPRGLSGQFPPQIVPWVNVPIWGVLQSFLMPVANEMYTCMRVNKEGNIMPTFIARQIPFNTDHMPNNHAVTYFSNLPRWKVEPMQVLTDDTCKTNALRCNFVQVKPQSAAEMVHDEAWARAMVNPRWDAADIARSGVFPHVQTANQLISQGGEVNWWVKLVTDRDMNGHLKYSGQVISMGIQEPICEGDNLQYGDMIFHIEAVQHDFFVNPANGSKNFNTTIIVSNGVPEGFPATQPDPEILGAEPQTTLEEN